MTRSWDDLKEELQRECFRKSVAEIAREIHCHRSTLYRLINGEHQTPSGPLEYQVSQLVSGRDSRPRQPSDTQP